MASLAFSGHSQGLFHDQNDRLDSWDSLGTLQLDWIRLKQNHAWCTSQCTPSFILCHAMVHNWTV